MLENLLTALQLATTKPNLPSPELYTKPTSAIYAKVTQNGLSEKLDPNKRAEKDINYEIIFLREVIASNAPTKEQAIKKLGDLYYNLVTRGVYKRLVIEEALGFYEDIMGNHPRSGYLAEAYLKSGLIHATIKEPRNTEDVRHGIASMILAYKIAELIGDLNTKKGAAGSIAKVGADYIAAGKEIISKNRVIFYINEFIKLERDEEVKKEAKRLLNEIQPKTKK